ncbi:Gfo/Idh/MocA family protein [Alicyclobacillus ferrooxydans]|uniref:Oxidoreductase n=1 Tax=Alicyclobacillus ferrooxydans TaxID=471514 RepID=A0A0P9CEC4_9BACL|nr:Gfo/Idh/MocA family oxidoreductase [Alicyclobacillus ferrooxydans]KPV43966.1 oxidoreductase [Alicyclobacillus ferrooxydans]
MIPFVLVGAGWRAEFFIRIAQQLPDRFTIQGLVARNQERAKVIKERFGVPTYSDLDEALKHSDPSFVIVCVPRTQAPKIVIDCARKGIPVLCETPPAHGVDEMLELNDALGSKSKVQIAEQYIFQPNHAARLSIVASGILGDVTQAQISIAHDYHGVSLIRHMLSVGFEDAEIWATEFKSPIVEGPGFDGPPTREEVRPSQQLIAVLRFGDKCGVFDFTDDQYFSWIRSPRMLIRGQKGEINNFEVRYLKDYASPVEVDLKRTYAGHDGNLEGLYLKSIFFGREAVYTNQFVPGRLTDDEVAIATCLEKMHDYVQGGPSFYSVAEASQDNYIALMIHQAVKSRELVRTSRQSWSPSRSDHV